MTGDVMTCMMSFELFMFLVDKGFYDRIIIYHIGTCDVVVYHGMSFQNEALSRHFGES